MSRNVPPRVIALTGGIASGKTAVSDRFAALGVPVVDTDLLAREVVAPGTPGLAEVAGTFGVELLDEHGALDRRALRERIFSDADARRRLEAILHPRIEQAARQAIDRAGSDPRVRYVVLVVPQLRLSAFNAEYRAKNVNMLFPPPKDTPAICDVDIQTKP